MAQGEKKASRRIRPTLLVLLLLWAGCMFLVVDLFKNVPEFDRIRPSARTYQAMRYAAHKMVGEPYHDGGFRESVSADHGMAPVDALQAALARVQELEAARSFDGLRTEAATAADPRVRIVALRSLASVFGAKARPTLEATVGNPDEVDKVRSQAARYLGRTGPDALLALDELLASDLADNIRSGAAQGLGELGTAAAAERALALSTMRASATRGAAVDAIGRITSEEAAPLLIEAASDRARHPDARAAACRALAAGRRAQAVGALTEILEDDRNHPDVRAAAADALGRIGDRSALPALEKAAGSKVDAVARAAKLGRTRLSNVRAG